MTFTLSNDLEFIYARRSIRKFISGMKVSNEIITEILQAAMSAPSACQCDPWDFIVIEERESLAEFSSSFNDPSVLLSASHCILVCGDVKKAFNESLDFVLQDCSAAIQNMLLAASTLELGSSWHSIIFSPQRVKDAKKIFGIPDEIIPIAIIPIGYPNEFKESRTRYKPDLVHMNQW